MLTIKLHLPDNVEIEAYIRVREAHTGYPATSWDDADPGAAVPQSRVEIRETCGSKTKDYDVAYCVFIAMYMYANDMMDYSQPDIADEEIRHKLFEAWQEHNRNDFEDLNDV